MAYDPAVIRAITRIGRKRGEPTRYITGQLATGIVESGLRNLPGGDADSYGFRQQRASIYGRQPLNKQINNLYDEFHQYDKGQPLGQLIADVQRPAAQYRDRYGKVLDQARALLGGNFKSAAATPSTPMLGADTTQQPAAPSTNIFDTLAGLNAQKAQTDTHAAQLQRGWQLLSSLMHQKEDASNPVNVEAGVGTPTEGYNAGSGALGSIIAQANKIDRAKVPYLWGGGHQSKQSPNSKVTPVDCSGAVSRVLGVNPMVSGQFAKWGKPGRGKSVTIYANGEHVLMEINGHFWGTSQANPGGGAGWIPSSAISPDYLKRFKARHPPGL